MTSGRTAVHVRPRMGTLLAISVSPSRGADHARDIHTAFDIASRCERLMSRHDPASALSRLNRSAGGPGLSLPDLARILGEARDLSRRLDGAFDPTVAPLVDLWDRAARRGRAAARRAIEQTLTRVGAQALSMESGRVSIALPGASLDLGGFGKGVTLDRIAAALRRDGCSDAVLNFGESSLLHVGRRGCRSVVLRDPSGGFAGEFAPGDRACSTSATFGREIRIGARVLGHVIDPRTGMPLTRAAQVTVLAGSAAMAEAVSTALLVLGRDAVDDIARRMAVDVCWIDRSGVHQTAGFGLTPLA